MKKFLFYFVLFSSVYAHSQTTIVEEKYEKDNIPMRYHYLPKNDKIVIEKGAYVSMSFNRRINNITSYDSNGKKEILKDNFETAESFFSITENTFKLVDFTKFSGAKSYKYIVNGKETLPINFSDVDRNYNNFIRDKYYVNSTFGNDYFNDKYELDIVDIDGRNKVEYSKDKLCLETLNLFTKSKKIIPLDKPDISRLIAEESLKPKEYLGYSANLIDNEKFEIITKSISKDYKSSILFRTFYNMEGKKIGEKKYDISMSSNYLTYSANPAARIGPKFDGFANATPIFFTDIAVNDFITDNITGDIYIYGLFSNKAKELNDDNSPGGFYIFKFDKEGHKVWESINAIDDKNDFNKKIHLVTVFSNLSINDKGLLFETGGRFSDNYFHYSILDKNTGKILSKNKILYEKDKVFTMRGDVRMFLYSFYENKDFKKKVFDIDGLVAIDTNKKVADYLKNINSKNKLFFNTIISENGTWLMESDNENYYKVTFFKS